MKRKIPNSTTPRLMALLFASMLSMAVNAGGRTKLVVNIVVDGLRLENLDELSRHLSDKGFNRLTINGVTIENVDFGTNLDPVASTAMLMTGAAPSVNGIPSATIYNTAEMRAVNVLDDGKTIGNYTNETYSLERLAVTTIADEIRIAGGGVSYSHAIAPDAMISLLLGGHAANSAVWLNDKSGNWASSTYFKEFPISASNTNRLMPLATRLDTISWKPADGINGMNILPDHLTRYPFRYTFPRNNVDRIYNYKSSPLVNTEVTRLASEYISSMKLGTHDGTDVLSLGYTLIPYPASKSAESRYEQIDSYIKLDAELARLMATIDQNVGIDNTVIVLASTPPSTTRRVDINKWNLPGGQFSTRKAVSLLNMYLMAKHGNGQWVKAYHNGQFYLDASLAEKNNIDIVAMRTDAGNFLARMSGVHNVVTIDQLLTGSNDSDRSDAMRRNVDPRLCGDLFIDILPGWELVDDFTNPSQKRANQTSKSVTTAPVIVLAPGVKASRIVTPVDARSIAPTMARLLRIRSPNGAEVPPLNLER